MKLNEKGRSSLRSDWREVQASVKSCAAGINWLLGSVSNAQETYIKIQTLTEMLHRQFKEVDRGLEVSKLERDQLDLAFREVVTWLNKREEDLDKATGAASYFFEQIALTDKDFLTRIRRISKSLCQSME